MKPINVTSAVLLSSCAGFISSAYADDHIDANADVVQLRMSCQEAGAPLNNCFTDLASLNGWQSARATSETNPLLVKIGPGSFDGTYNCTGKSNIAIKGAGKGVTILNPTSGFSAGMRFVNCTNISVSDMTIKGTYGAVQWDGSGISAWDDVEVLGLGRGWYETNSTCDQAQTKHYWTGSRIEAIPHFTLVNPYDARCGEHWFFGSEITANGIDSSGMPNVIAGVPGSVWAISAAGTAEMHVYGSVLRALVKIAGYDSNPISAARVSDQGEIHIHGTGIDVLSDVSRPIEVLQAVSGMIHANEAAYNLRTGEGATITRIKNIGGHVHAPYMWAPHDTPPNIISVDGSDIAVVTSTAGGHPELTVYDSSCPGQWYNIATQSCH
jgi:hypothetical protein